MWDVVRGLPVCRLLEVPRPDEHDGRDEWRDQRLAALVSAYHAGGDPVLLGWRRAEAFGPTEVFVGGSGLLADRDGQEATLSLPAGGRGVMLPEGLAEDAMAHWVSIGGIADGLLVDDPAPEEPARPSLEDGLLSVWMQPFAWMLVAEPVEPEEARRLADDLADRQQRAQSMAEMSPEESVAALRMDKRHRELRQAATSGLWRVHLTAGAATPRAAARVAALVCASADLSRLPYALVPGAEGPFEASTQLVAALARPPVREVAGVRFVMRPEFDVTPESAATGVRLGRVLDRNRRDVGEMSLPLSSLNRHTFVCGATGAGKSQTVRSLLTAASEAGLPWMVVEPAKAEYRLMAARLPDAEVVTIRPGDAEAVAAGINPLEPALGPDGRPFSLQTHADLVRALFLAAFEAEEPFPQVLAAALTRCYERLGWDLALGEPLNTVAGGRGGSSPTGQTTRLPGGVGGRPRATRRSPTCRPPPSRSWTTSATARRSPTTSAASSGSGCPASGSAPPGGSSRAATRSTSTRCCRATWCWRSRTSGTTATRRS
ncbi:DUF853 family protein [Actinomadura madurae]|uniref:helicase HerA-like domain-containing protein n=1 Tax=Actinomadura madurae TaxID=1993 RepID=UPI0020D1F689|nr:helicase HerA-like domain-containing protein [Actinomadura madurae]MCP9949301.1 DUF853 family protein [Actinomadura madurae]